MSDFAGTARAEIERLEEDVLYTEKAHFAAATTLHKLHVRLGVFATGAAAASVATIVAKTSTWVPGVLALAASIGSAVLTFIKPEERAAQHLEAGRTLGDLRVRMRQFRTLDLGANVEPDWVRRTVASFTKEKAAADASAPALGDRSFKRGKKVIEEGRFAHVVDRLSDDA